MPAATSACPPRPVGHHGFPPCFPLLLQARAITAPPRLYHPHVPPLTPPSTSCAICRLLAAWTRAVLLTTAQCGWVTQVSLSHVRVSRVPVILAPVFVREEESGKRIDGAREEGRQDELLRAQRRSIVLTQLFTKTRSGKLAGIVSGLRLARCIERSKHTKG